MFPVVLRSQDTDKFVLFKSPVDGQFVHELFIVNKAFETLQPSSLKSDRPQWIYTSSARSVAMLYAVFSSLRIILLFIRAFILILF